MIGTNDLGAAACQGGAPAIRRAAGGPGGAAARCAAKVAHARILLLRVRVLDEAATWNSALDFGAGTCNSALSLACECRADTGVGAEHAHQRTLLGNASAVLTQESLQASTAEHWRLQ